MKRVILGLLLAGSTLVLLIVGGLWIETGSYGIHVLLRNGGAYWVTVRPDDPRLSRSVRLALAGPPVATGGNFEWRVVRSGFEVGALPVIAGGEEVDRIHLARIDPTKFRFEVHNAAAGDRNLNAWMARLGAALVINGSFYSRRGTPDTPVLSAGTLMGPKTYDAKAGAFVATADFVGIRDLAHQSWQAAFDDAHDAMVSYPLLVSESSERRVAISQWLANRSFVGQDAGGRIILGTTGEGFFSLDRLAEFLRQAPLDLKLALNLDGGPVACQGIWLDGFERRMCGKWEIQAKGDDVKLLSWPYGTAAMPIVMAVFPK
jgi:hypothetical protein